MPIDNYSMATLTEFVGRDLVTTPWMTITQERINTFAECTGDHQWIHVDAERAKRESPFGTPIAHGFLTLSLIAAFGTATAASSIIRSGSLLSTPTAVCRK
jgi:acyl dehydratase